MSFVFGSSWSISAGAAAMPVPEAFEALTTDLEAMTAVSVRAGATTAEVDTMFPFTSSSSSEEITITSNSSSGPGDNITVGVQLLLRLRLRALSAIPWKGLHNGKTPGWDELLLRLLLRHPWPCPQAVGAAVGVAMGAAVGVGAGTATGGEARTAAATPTRHLPRISTR
jgi:hypothetical protein